MDQPSHKLRLPQLPPDPAGARVVAGRVLTSTGIPVVGRLPTVVRNAVTPPPVSESGDEAVRFGSMIETAFLVAAADGYLSAGEVDTLADCIGGAGVEIDDDELGDFIDQLADALEEDGIVARLRAISATLTDPASRREALAFAALTALSNGKVGTSEADALLSIGQAFDITPDEVQRTIDKVAGEMTGKIPLY